MPKAYEDPSDNRMFEEIYRGSYSLLVGQLFLVTTSRAEAEEVVQEAFARLWGRWSLLKDYENIESWVRRVAMNYAIDRWRRSMRHDQLPENMFGNDDPAGSNITVVMGLRRLPIKQRSALFLHHVVGLSVEEVANEMSTKSGTVKSWLSRGRVTLESYLHEKESDIHD